MVRWHHPFTGHELWQSPGDGEGQGSLSCCSPWGRKELDTTWWLNDNNKVTSLSLNYLCQDSVSKQSPAEVLDFRASTCECEGHDSPHNNYQNSRWPLQTNCPWSACPVPEMPPWRQTSAKLTWHILSKSFTCEDVFDLKIIRSPRVDCQSPGCRWRPLLIKDGD